MPNIYWCFLLAYFLLIILYPLLWTMEIGIVQNYTFHSSSENCRLASECANLNEIIVSIDTRKEYQVWLKPITFINCLFTIFQYETFFKSKKKYSFPEWDLNQGPLAQQSITLTTRPRSRWWERCYFRPIYIWYLKIAG